MTSPEKIMNKKDPWAGYEYGKLDSEIYQSMGFAGITTSFRLDIGRLFAYCKQNSFKVNPTLMKICHHLSEKHLPKLTLGLNHRVYDAGFSLGFVKLVERGEHFVEPVVISKESDGSLNEINLRSFVPVWQKTLMKNLPRTATFLAKHVIPGEAVKSYPSFQVSRGFLPSVGERITSAIMTTPRSHGLSIPYGNIVNATFLVPHAFANLNYYNSFLEEIIFMIENPGEVSAEIMSASYKELA